jgi:hypothetical protein
MVYVHVIGTEEIGSTSFAKHTEYIVEIKYMGFAKCVHLRFSEMDPFIQRMQREYSNHLNITKEETLRKTWFNNHKPKIIEDRKRMIEQILQKMLNHELVKLNPRPILEEFKIDTNFLSMTPELKSKRVAFIANQITNVHHHKR